MTISSTVAGPLLIAPRIQRYEWGDPLFLPRIFGLPEGPCAEAWFGAHPIAPATALVGGAWGRLDHVIAERGDEILGPRIRKRFGGLPYLLKLLSAASPLSIQVHATKSQAEEGFAREQEAAIPLWHPTRCYRDRNHKPELLVALTPFHALVGLRRHDEIRRVLTGLPEMSRLLPHCVPSPAGIRRLLASYFALPKPVLQSALGALLDRLSVEDSRSPFQTTDPAYWALQAHRFPCAAKEPDPGLLFIFLMELVRLEPGQAVFLPPGVLHAYLRGTGVELMANSDNVLRAGLTGKHVDPKELLRVASLDHGLGGLVGSEEGCPGVETIYRVPAVEIGLRRMRLEPGRRIECMARGPETLLALSDSPKTVARVGFGGKSLDLGAGQACLVPDGLRYALEVDGEGDIFRAGVAEDEYVKSNRVSRGVSVVSTGGRGGFAGAVVANIDATERFLIEGSAAAVIGAVSGTSHSRIFWERHLEQARRALGAREAISFHEDLPVNQALGLLLMWRRLRPRLRSGEGALVAFVFGEGSRAAPFTEAESGQKPAIRSFVASGSGREKRLLPMVELAMRYFAPIEGYLRRSGFDGVVVKWGDEVQIPTFDLTGTDSRFAGADIVRFVSMREVTPDEALNKDWIGVDQQGMVTAFIPRRPIQAMEALADRGILQRRGGRLHGGVNLGSIAVSRVFLDALLEEFDDEIDHPFAKREERPDLDPQIFSALTVAMLDDRAEREHEWTRLIEESDAIRKLDEIMPRVVERLRGVLDRFRMIHGRKVRIVAMDFNDQYWGDIGQHRKMFEFYMALASHGEDGQIARALAGVTSRRDSRGNIIAGDTVLGEGVEARNSVLIDARIGAGQIIDSVLIGTRCASLHARQAFDIRSTALTMCLAPRGGTYGVIAGQHVEAGPGERLASVFLPDRELLLRVHEETDLQDRRANYDVPILGNPVSFRELHAVVAAADPPLVEARRLKRLMEVERLLD